MRTLVRSNGRGALLDRANDLLVAALSMKSVCRSRGFRREPDTCRIEANAGDAHVDLPVLVDVSF